jgi:hypothetical protein
VTLETFSIGWIFETLAAQEGINLQVNGFSDLVCYGFLIPTDKKLSQVLRENAAALNYLIVDGDPIRLVCRPVNDDLTIDFNINETECIRRGEAPSVTLTRIEPSNLPRQVEIQYIDADRDYAVSAQQARHTAAPLTNTSASVGLDFVLSAQQARDMAFDLLYRLWSQQLNLEFEHKDLSIEPGDVVLLTTTRGAFTCIVTKNTINMPARTNSIKATILLTSKGQTIQAPQADSFDSNSSDDWSAWMAAA